MACFSASLVPLCVAGLVSYSLSGLISLSMAGLVPRLSAGFVPLLPPYSPDFNPIEKAFSKLKAHLRKAAERTASGLWDAIGRLIDLFTRQECANFFAAAGYDAI